ncbi:MAG: siderophore-interacting protein [Pseudomonadota bacterium]
MPAQYQLTVAHNDSLTPHMRRIRLTGSDLRDFPADQESGYVKLLVEREDGETVPRSYTIRAFDARREMLTLDFVDHGDSGPASAWARRAEPGAAVTIRGPGEKKLADPAADWFFLAADLSALPALAVNLEVLRRDASGYAIIEVPSLDDRQNIDAPTGIDVQWIVNEDAAAPNRALVDTVLRQPWLEGRAYPWFAGEFDGMRALRKYFRDERGIDRKAMYLSCYWKLGDTDEGMKKAKRRDAESDAQTLTAVGAR